MAKEPNIFDNLSSPVVPPDTLAEVTAEITNLMMKHQAARIFQGH